MDKVCERTAVITRENTSEVTTSGSLLTGYAIVFNARSQLIHEHGESFYEIIDAGAFDESIASRNITAVFKHDDDSEYGDTATKTLKLWKDEKGYAFELALQPYANSLKSKVATGAVRGMSFSFKPTEVYVDGEGIRHIKKGELLHISPVYSPAYPQTVVKLKTNTNSNKHKLLDIAEKL